jgi:AsmA protein
MKKFLRRFLIIFSITLVVLIGLTAAGAAIFKKQIGGRIVQEINEQISTELTVTDINLSFFKNFPYAAVVLKDVVLNDAQEGVLLEAKDIAFNIGLMGLIRSNFKLDAATVSNGAITIRIDEQGKANYLIFNNEKESEEAADDSDNSNIKVELSQTQLQNMELIYADELTEQYYNMVLDKADFTGSFAQNQFNLISKADITSYKKSMCSLARISSR